MTQHGSLSFTNKSWLTSVIAIPKNLMAIFVILKPSTDKFKLCALGALSLLLVFREGSLYSFAYEPYEKYLLKSAGRNSPPNSFADLLKSTTADLLKFVSRNSPSPWFCRFVQICHCRFTQIYWQKSPQDLISGGNFSNSTFACTVQ